ncbi:response regulator [Siphonobacter sp.]|uniref:response regulator n=1 Tax=Siphonobacter sp. TaxID=1869184 RepID=UPI003B3A46E8
MKVLIVDDDFIMLKLHQLRVINAGLSLKPQLFYNGREALNFLLAAEETDEQYLILLDLNMPIMSGWQFLEALQQQALRSTIRVVIITSSVDPADRQRAKDYPQVAGYLEKPLNRQGLDLLASVF